MVEDVLPSLLSRTGSLTQILINAMLVRWKYGRRRRVPTYLISFSVRFLHVVLVRLGFIKLKINNRVETWIYNFGVVIT